MSQCRPYYVLLARDNEAKGWQCQFGDYDRQTVKAEQADVKGEYWQTMVVKVENDSQLAIDAAIAIVNKG
jgi:hypothetical protein